ncbi:MAG: AAA family ATPase [Deltaproteobacteria bacterium]|nr:AAA family ATPase [Deltaproteobacteria bacterium]
MTHQLIVEESRWQPFGPGRMAPAGSLADPALAARLSAYKRNVAGNYQGVSPADVATALPPGPYIASEKVDGETWFLQCEEGSATLLSPSGKAITGIPVTAEAERLGAGWTGLLAGELYATSASGRPRVFDLHAALGGGAGAQPDRLRFAAFDLLDDGGVDALPGPYEQRAQRLQALLAGGTCVHSATSETAADSPEVAALFERMVTLGGAEGLVVHAPGGRVYKVKPEITIDAAVVGFGAGDNGVYELLLALLRPDDTYQLIGRVRTGWSHREKRELAEHLAQMECVSTLRRVTDQGTLCRWVRPEFVVEVKCNDLLVANSRDEPIRRMAMAYSDQEGWSPLGPVPAVSMINSVFLRIREDKRAQRPDIRFEQVADLVPVRDAPAPSQADLPAATLLRREVYTKPTPVGPAVRKVLAWKTNKETIDPACPPYVVFFTDYSPGRREPLQTEVRVAGSPQSMHAFADDWLARKIRRGWELVARTDTPATAAIEPDSAGGSAANLADTPAPPRPSGRTLTIAFARSSSPTFPIVRRRLEALAKLGRLAVTPDDKGREAWFELTIENALVENARRIANLLAIVRAWKTTEVSLDGDLLGKHDLDGFLERLETVRRCWLRHKHLSSESCRTACPVGCAALRIWPSYEYLSYSGNPEPPWYAVGAFDGRQVAVDKEALRRQLEAPRNAEVRLCPHFDLEGVEARIATLPGTLSADDRQWITVYHFKDGKPAWIWPKGTALPVGLRDTKESPWRSGGLNIRVDLGQGRQPDLGTTSTPPPTVRTIPPARYADVHGQDAAVEAIRDLVELPLRHADLFARIGASPRAQGAILAGPPGTGKSLLARAVAGECGAHIEVVSGPSLLSKWVGETEAALRGIFERAREHAPAVILFDEIDCLGASRASADAHHQKSMVTQLLALLDGLDERGQVFVLATTNRPEDIDPALRRPGRFDQVVWMGPPDEPGRKAIFLHHMQGLKLADNIDRYRLAAELAAATPAFTGADIAYTCQRAALLCVKEASTAPDPPVTLAITADHFRAAIASQGRATTENRRSDAAEANAMLLARGMN